MYGKHEPDQQVDTVVGTLPISALMYTTKEYKAPNEIGIAREWFYIGDDPEVKAKVAQLEHPYVKRDAWMTILCGVSTTAVAELK